MYYVLKQYRVKGCIALRSIVNEAVSIALEIEDLLQIFSSFLMLVPFICLLVQS